MQLRTMRIVSLALPFVLAGSVAFAGEDSDARAAAWAKGTEAQLIDLVAKISPAYVVIGGGSGVCISPDGWMLTNHHVAGSKKPGDVWSVKMPGRKILKATMVGTDPRGDISVLKIESDEPLPFVPLGDSDSLVAGDMVIALGNPFGFAKDATPTVTLGVVSATHRFQGGYSDAIQVDAPINPGNSGGPSISLKGEVIGINGRVAVRFGNRVNTGVGYAIPANQIKNFMKAFKAGGVVKHGFLGGVNFADSKLGNAGARVNQVKAGTSAAGAGLKKDDLIIEAAGYRIHSASRLHGVVGTFPAGDEIEIKVRRGDSESAMTVVLDSRAEGANAPFLGVRMAQEPPEGGKGVEVEEVIKGSAAEAAGLVAGDIVLSLGGKEVNSAEDLAGVIGGFKVGQSIDLLIKRGSQELTVKAKLGKRE